jgi:Fur family transcriptional regulator, ferric uptake regulator
MEPASKPVRLPKNYDLIYDIIRAAGAGVHLTTSDVFARAKDRRPQIGFSTVYRGIARLRDLELIDEISVPGAESAVYELAGKPHAHFRCSTCGVVEDVWYQVSPSVISAIAEQTGAQIDDTTLTLHGQCRTCRDRLAVSIA